MKLFRMIGWLLGQIVKVYADAVDDFRWNRVQEKLCPFGARGYLCSDCGRVFQVPQLADGRVDPELILPAAVEHYMTDPKTHSVRLFIFESL